MHERGKVFVICLQFRLCVLVCVVGVLMCFSNLISLYSYIDASRMPMKSWLMEVCSNSPTKRKLHDVCQPEDACHLIKEEDSPRKEDIEKMCSKGYFTK